MWSLLEKEAAEEEEEEEGEEEGEEREEMGSYHVRVHQRIALFSSLIGEPMLASMIKAG